MAKPSGVVGGTLFTAPSVGTSAATGAAGIVEADRKFAALRGRKAAERAKLASPKPPPKR